jgi:soluble lytic murein transglycosylase-like protein
MMRRTLFQEATVMKNRRRALKGSILTLTGLTAASLVDMTEPAKFTDVERWFTKEQTLKHKDYDFLVAHIRSINPNIEPGEDDRLARCILKESALLRIPPQARMDGQPVDPVLFITAIIETESSFNRRAVSQADARGYMQVMPATLLWIRDRTGMPVDPADIHETEVNLMLGVHYLNYLFEELQDPAFVALAYNAGPGNLRRGFYDLRYWMKVQRFYTILKKKKGS